MRFARAHPHFLKRLFVPCRRNPVGVVSFGNTVTQGSSQTRNPGLRGEIPSGFHWKIQTPVVNRDLAAPAKGLVSPLNFPCNSSPSLLFTSCRSATAFLMRRMPDGRG